MPAPDTTIGCRERHEHRRLPDVVLVQLGLLFARRCWCNEDDGCSGRGDMSCTSPRCRELFQLRAVRRDDEVTPLRIGG